MSFFNPTKLLGGDLKIRKPTLNAESKQTKKSTAALVKYFERRTEDLKLNPSNKPRILFVSLFFLAKNWKEIPLQMLFDAMFVLNIKRSWLIDWDPSQMSDKEMACRHSSVLSKIYTRLTSAFVQLIKLKDKQGLILWLPEDTSFQIDEFDGLEEEAILSRAITFSRSNTVCSLSDVDSKSDENMDYYSDFNSDNESDSDDDNDGSGNGSKLSVNRIRNWIALSQQLSNIVDPTSGDQYDALTLDALLYADALDKGRNLKYCNSLSQVVKEIGSCTFQYKTVLEIFEFSCPTLIPMVKFDHSVFEERCTAIEMYHNVDTVSPTVSSKDESITKCDDDDEDDDDMSGFVFL